MTSAALSRVSGDNRPSAIVVGAGIAGLSAALYLAERGFCVSVYEKEKQAGGNLGATVAKARKRGDGERANFFEVYPHMFGDWYNNFWEIMDKIGRGKKQSDLWRPMTEFKFLPKPKTRAELDQPCYKTLRNNGSLESALANLVANIIPFPDMFLASYAALGLLVEDFTNRDGLSVATLNDFLNTRFYSTRYVTKFYQMVILYIWSIQPDETSAYACQRFFKYQSRRPTPTAWVLKSGDAYTSVIAPIVDHLESKYQVKFYYDTAVVAASVNKEKTSLEQLMIIENFSDSEKRNVKTIQKSKAKEHLNYYVFALPPETLSALVQTPIPPKLSRRDPGTAPQVNVDLNKTGIITNITCQSSPGLAPSPSLDNPDLPIAETQGPDDGVTIVESASDAEAISRRSFGRVSQQLLVSQRAIVDVIPQLATTKSLSAEPIPVLYIAFHREAKMSRLIPKDSYVGLTESKYSLTLVDMTDEFKSANPQLFGPDSRVGAIITLAASDYSELPVSKNPSVPAGQGSDPPSAYAQALQDQSSDLLLAEAMNYLPFEKSEIEWCFFRTNINHRLFLNDVESQRNPVKPIYLNQADSRPIIDNLVFAGDYCSQDVVMASVEAAVESGFRAGMQLHESYRHKPAHHQQPSVSAISSPSDDKPLSLQSYSSYPTSLITVSKLLLMPYAVWAKSLSDLNVLLEDTRQAAAEPKPFSQEVLPPLLNYWPQQASMCLGAYKEAVDTMTSLAVTSLITSSKLFGSLFNHR